MFKKKINNKGFTLIELLAVIVILGVLMIIAVPMVTQYIQSSKQSAFVATAKAYVSSARYAYLNGDYDCGRDINSGSGGVVAIFFKDIKVDKNNGNSPFNQRILDDKSYVLIKAETNGKYTYYVQMIDEGNNGFSYINEDELAKKNVKINTSTLNNANVPPDSIVFVSVGDGHVATSSASFAQIGTSNKYEGICYPIS